MDTRLIARIARKGGGKLLHHGVARFLPDKPKADVEKPAKRTFIGLVVGAAITRLATRSVPGAIVVGGGMLAKALYDRRQAKKALAAAPGEKRDDDLS